MNVYMTEDEQVEAIKKWWGKWGNHLLTVILIILLAVTGTKWYRQYRYNIKTHASQGFEQLMQSYAKKEETGVSAQSHYLMSNYPSTIYAEGSALMLAKQAISEGKWDEAITHLTWVKDNTKTKPVKQIARLRLARVLMSQKKYQQGLSLLETVDDKTYMMLVHEIRGDIYLAQGKKTDARSQYLLAIQALPKKNVVPPELKMKLNHVTARVYHVAKETARQSLTPQSQVTN